MSVLEIVLICLLSLTGAAIALYVVALCIIERYMIKKVDEYTLVNKFARKHGIVLLGDSLTEFYPVHEFFPCTHIHNRGISGNTTQQVLNRLDSNVIAISPSTVFLWIGTNDLGKAKTNNAQKVFDNIQLIVSRLTQALQNVKIIMLSEIPVNRKAGKISPFVVGRRTNQKLVQINNLLQGYCTQNSIDYIDLFTPLADQRGCLSKQYTIEGLHLSMDGYEVVSKHLAPYIEQCSKQG